jgi:hypothetical protein
MGPGILRAIGETFSVSSGAIILSRQESRYYTLSLTELSCALINPVGFSMLIAFKKLCGGLQGLCSRVDELKFWTCCKFANGGLFLLKLLDHIECYMANLSS